MQPVLITDRRTVIRSLARDSFSNLMSLKMLSLYPAECSTTLYRRGDEWASLTELSAKVSAWDRKEYSGADLVVMLDGNSPALLEYALDRIPTDHTVLKVHGEWSRARLSSSRRFRLANSFPSYTTSDLDALRWSASTVQVQRHSDVAEDARPLFGQMGYTREELQLHFSRHAQWFAVYDAATPVSVCLVFEVFDRIWEIGAVFTTPTHRRKGYAGAVVRAALTHLAESNLTPRYQFHASNTASRTLAESLGLRLGLTVDHYVTDRA